jgi:hypothetical protein
MAELVYERGYSYNPGFIISRFINAIIGIVEFVLSLRLLFELFGANPASPFVAWLYGMTDRLIAPFQFAFPSFSIAGFTLNMSVILAMFAYAILGWVVAWFLSLIFDTP